jgi:hypothetical protein
VQNAKEAVQSTVTYSVATERKLMTASAMYVDRYIIRLCPNEAKSDAASLFISRNQPGGWKGGNGL